MRPQVAPAARQPERRPDLPAAARKRKLPYDTKTARRHLLKSEPAMRQIVEQVGPCLLELRGGPYRSLLRGLLYQQLAGAAAAAIERRLLGLFGDRIPRPDELLTTTLDELRAVGVSRQKASYLHSLAEHFQSGALNDRTILRASDERAIEMVTHVKGIGPWTADMLLMFTLGRPDILPVGDLGIQNAIRAAYNLDSKPDAETMERIAEPWQPYRTVASWYLWRSTDVITADNSL